MLDPYWTVCESEVRFKETRIKPPFNPATGKQMGLIRWLTQRLEIPMYLGVATDRRLASAFIDALKDYEHFLTLDATTQEHIRRIWRGELKHEPGPWDS